MFPRLPVPYLPPDLCSHPAAAEGAVDRSSEERNLGRGRRSCLGRSGRKARSWGPVMRQRNAVSKKTNQTKKKISNLFLKIACVCVCLCVQRPQEGTECPPLGLSLNLGRICSGRLGATGDRQQQLVSTLLRHKLRLLTWALSLNSSLHDATAQQAPLTLQSPVLCGLSPDTCFLYSTTEL